MGTTHRIIQSQTFSFSAFFSFVLVGDIFAVFISIWIKEKRFFCENEAANAGKSYSNKITFKNSLIIHYEFYKRYLLTYLLIFVAINFSIAEYTFWVFFPSHEIGIYGGHHKSNIIVKSYCAFFNSFKGGWSTLIVCTLFTCCLGCFLWCGIYSLPSTISYNRISNKYDILCHFDTNTFWKIWSCHPDVVPNVIIPYRINS